MVRLSPNSMHSKRLQSIAAALVLVSALFAVAGCGSGPGLGRAVKHWIDVARIEAELSDRRELQEDLSVAQVGATREQVEGVLGEPDDSETHHGATVYAYRHSHGSATGVMYVTYGSDGTVVRGETAGQRYYRESQEKLQRDQRELQEDLLVVQVGATREQVEAVLGEPDDSETQRRSTRRPMA